MQNLYSFILFNIESLNSIVLEDLLLELQIYHIALYLKNKFKDTRSIPVLINLVKEECF